MSHVQAVTFCLRIIQPPKLHLAEPNFCRKSHTSDVVVLFRLGALLQVFEERTFFNTVILLHKLKYNNRTIDLTDILIEMYGKYKPEAVI